MSAAFLAACVVGSPTAYAAAACEWVTTDLPVPAGVTFNDVHAGSDNGEWVLGQGYDAAYVAGTFVWHNGVPTGEFIPQARVGDVNNYGVLMSNANDAAYRIKDGVRERLEPAPESSSRSWGEHINNAGDVAGLSGYMSMYGPVLVWPAGSTTPRELPNTRNGLVRIVKGIDDAGNVVALEMGPVNQHFSHVWDRDGRQTRLETLPGDYSADVEFIRDGRIFGKSVPQDWQQPSTVVEWGMDGKVVRTFPEIYNPLDVDASGHVLGQVSNSRNAVWRGPGQLDTPPGLQGVLMAENGDVYGTESDENFKSRPRHARCG
ncbi:hypothetical protein [Lentzea flaviverrucosa]|uniref:hypothetical protein n=1 Tax=Lentzea flaviverrucosa TaxID=200379 RepID=UPI001160C0EE|nr:hypothetical protein [Lentzea flaviverrucosa]